MRRVRQKRQLRPPLLEPRPEEHVQPFHPRLLHRLVLAQPVEVVPPELHLPLVVREEEPRPLDEPLLEQLPPPPVLAPQVVERPLMAVEELVQERPPAEVVLPVAQ